MTISTWHSVNVGKQAPGRSGPWATPGVRKVLWFSPSISSCLWSHPAIPTTDKRVGKISQTCPGAEGCIRGAGRTGPMQTSHAGPPRLGDSHSHFWAAPCFGVVIRGWQMLWGICPTLLCPRTRHLKSCPSEGSGAPLPKPHHKEPLMQAQSVWAGTGRSLLYMLRVRAS